MRRWLLSSSYIFTILIAWPGDSAWAYIADDRWNSTATNPSTGSQGTPVTLTWSFARDGTDIPGESFGTVDSNLINFLDTQFGAGPGGNDLAQRPWFTYFDQSFSRIGAISGLTFVYEANDDGRPFSSGSLGRGILGVRGDIRIGGKSYGSGSSTLASNYYPDYGEMMVNTDKGTYFSNGTSNYRRLRNTVMHELMHGVGISHVQSSNAAFLIEPSLSTAFDGPQLDDLLALQRLYGDFYEKNGGNDSFALATPLGLLAPTQPIAVGTLGDSTVIGGSQVDFLSIDDDSDTDFFSFSLTDRLDVQVQLTPRGTSYSVGPEGGSQSTFNSLALSNLSLALMDTNGLSVLNLSDTNPAGQGEQVLRQLLPGTYFVRIKGAQNDIQLYGLNLSSNLPAPANLVWVGNLGSNWVVGVANFTNGSGPTAFFHYDNVTFNDSSTVKAVSVTADVSVGALVIDTASSYVFTGTGGIVADSLTISGSGTVELANSGSSTYRAAEVAAGRLRISRAASFTGEVHVAQGAVLEQAAGQIFHDSTRLMGGGTIAGDVTMPGTIDPGDGTAVLTFTDSLSLVNSTVLLIELGGIARGVDYDALTVTGSANLAGFLDVSLIGAFAPAVDTTFEVLRADAGIFGQFDQVVLPPLTGQLAWEVTYSNTAVLLQVLDPNAVRLPGDFNDDGIVNAADYLVWRRGLGTIYTASDFDAWQANFGRSVGGGSMGRAAVPEPATAWLGCLALAGLLLRRIVRR